MRNRMRRPVSLVIRHLTIENGQILPSRLQYFSNCVDISLPLPGLQRTEAGMLDDPVESPQNSRVQV